MRGFLLLTSLLLLAGCSGESTAAGCGDECAGDCSSAPQVAVPTEQHPTDPSFAQTWGAGVSGGELTAISAILADPAAYVDKSVLVEGPAVAVCASRGCWFELGSDVEGQTLRFKVADGVMVFPPEVVGETMRAEGVFTANELDLETTKKVCENRAAKAGEEFDPDSVTECMTVYQISGTGAVQLVADAARQ